MNFFYSFQKLGYWEEHVTLIGESLRANIKILNQAVRENRISVMIHHVRLVTKIINNHIELVVLWNSN